MNDALKVYNLRFLQSDLRNYFSQEVVTYKEHQSFWIKNYRHYHIGVIGVEFAGYYGYVNNDFRYAVIPKYRGRGIGKKLVADALRNYHIKTIRVIKTNLSSIKCLKKCGFKVNSIREFNGIKFVELENSLGRKY
ncbi:GNAT family N-acetyltransferase [Prochlorococcus marinus]|uniref:GNAT family N-acetyltransferase n=1 Tax=Prochlorococcus sp. MIT 1342 TaxID=3082532 RepID=UPI0018C86030